MYRAFYFGAFVSLFAAASASHIGPADGRKHSPVSSEVYNELEELARVVDISYCVGTTNIQKPFQCLSRCEDFPHFELITTWSTGVLLSDSCGYIAIDHTEPSPRILVAFRGTQSISNAIADLSTIPQDYSPYDDDIDDEEDAQEMTETQRCANCTVHTGFLSSWHNTRSAILGDIQDAMQKYPDHRLTLVGHSLGGAIALLAALDFLQRGWKPALTTFGEPRVGNEAFVKFVDEQLVNGTGVSCRRVTHVDDPVPHLPLTEWGYHPHAGEVYISSTDLPPKRSDVLLCRGDADPACLAGVDDTLSVLSKSKNGKIKKELDASGEHWWDIQDLRKRLFPSRYRLWQLLFAHRDYFSRLGLCAKTGGPWWKGWFGSDHSNDL